MSKARRGFDEVYNAYRAIGEATLDDDPGSAVSYEIGYLDGFADAMHHLGLAIEGKPVKSSNAFPLHAVRGLRKRAGKLLKRNRNG